MGLNLALLPFAVFLLPGVALAVAPVARPRPGFCVLWAGPALLVYVLLHVGQAGYLLLLWPLVCFAAGTAALVAGDESARRRLRRRGWPVARAARPARLWSAVTFSVLAPLRPARRRPDAGRRARERPHLAGDVDLAAGLRPGRSGRPDRDARPGVVPPGGVLPAGRARLRRRARPRRRASASPSGAPREHTTPTSWPAPRRRGRSPSFRGHGAC